jgi:hypothetical protein
MALETTLASIARHTKHIEPPAEIQTSERPAPGIGFWKIALAVMVGNLLTGIVAGVVYALIRY